jgi:L-threonylcarbamoyladenylate synthase
LARVFEAKNRPHFDPLIIHLAAFAGLEKIAALDALSPSRRLLLEKLCTAFWPGPLTLILPKRPRVPDLATAGRPTVAVRFPAHPAAQKQIELSTGAVAAPSANPFGRLSPTTAEHVAAGLGGRIDCIIDGGPCSVGVESTVLDLSVDSPGILRPGGISREALEKITGPLGTTVTDTAPKGAEGAASPGLLKSHYAPGRPLFLHNTEEMSALSCKAGEGYLFFSGTTRDAWLSRNRPSGLTGPETAKSGADHVFTLSGSGSMLEAAANFFGYLHRLDRPDITCIRAETLPEEGLGAAVNDRLRRAAGYLK